MTPLWAGLVGCGAPPAPVPGGIEPGGKVAFTADGVAVPDAALDALIARLGRAQARQLETDDRTTEFVEHVALTQALYRRALEAGIHTDPEVRLLLAMGQREMLASEYLRWAAAREVTPEAVAARYAEMPEFRIPQLRVHHLRLRDEGDAPALRRRLAEGASFADLAREASTDPQTAPSGGDLGWLDRAVVEETFGAAAADAPAGAVLGPLPAAGAVHLLWIAGRRDAIPLAEVEVGLAEELRNEVRERITDQVRRDMRIERPTGGRDP